MEHAELQWKGPTPVSVRFHDVYASTVEALAEKRYVFLANNFLPERWRQRRCFVIGELGFGMGLSFLATWALWRDTAPIGARLHFVSVERYPMRRSDLARALEAWPELAPLARKLLDVWPPAEPGFHRLILESGRVYLTLLMGEAQDMLAQLCARVDAWFLDGFAPAVNEAMWSETLFRELVTLTRPGGTFATYTAAGRVRRALTAVGFAVEKIPGFGWKREMLRGRLVRPATARAEKPWFDIPVLPPDTARRAVVVGAGLAGTASAWTLASRGWHVTVVERHDEPAQEASGNPAGVIMPVVAADRNPLQRWAAAGYRYALRHLRRWGDQVEWSACGVLLAGWDQRNRRRQRLMLERLAPPLETVRPVDAVEASQLCGLPVDWDALFVPDGGWVNPPSLCRAQLAERRICILYRNQVRYLEPGDDQWRLLNDNGRLIASAPVVVVAAGKDAGRLGQTAGLPLRSVRGQVTELAVTARSKALGVVVCGPGYATPPRNGQHCIGATYNAENPDPKPLVSDHLRNREMLKEFFPALADELAALPATGRVAFRCSSPDHLPLVGPVPDEAAFRQIYADLHRGFPLSCYPSAPCYPGLYVNAGHGSRGLIFAPLAAELLASMIDGEPMPVERDLMQWLYPGRFLIRELRKRR